MNRLFKLLFWTSLLFAIISCESKPQENREGKLYIVTTTGMIEDALKNIAGDLAEVEGLMGPGVDPHLYKPTPGDLKKLREADVVFYSGLHLEGKMNDVFGKFGRTKPVFPVSDGVNEGRLLGIESGVHDPHIWFDVSIWKDAVAYAAVKLAEVDKENAAIYKANAEKYVKQLVELDAWVGEEIATIPEESRVLITAHDAFSYFGQAYNIEVRGLQGISTLSEFGLKDMGDLVNFISEKKIKAVFVESSVPAKSLEAVVSGCQEKGHDVKIGGTLYSDAMGAAGTPEGTYIGMVKANVNTIVGSLK